MVCEEDCRTAVLGKTERTVGWEGDGEPTMRELVRHCHGKPAATDRLYLRSLSHPFTLDIIAHCQSEVQARWLQARIATRLAQCHLELHPTKTHIVYCKEADRRGTFPQERFDFLGYTFRPRRSKNRRGEYFINFTPAISARATKAMRQTIRSWRLHLRSDKALDDLARMFNPILRGWVQYYGQYYKSALYPTFQVLDRILVKWAMRKYKKLKGHQRRATHWLGRIARRQPRLFVHWQTGVRPAAGR
jgi:RNA-directed DNA polymerase